MGIVLSFVKNQYDENVIENEIYLNNGFWYQLTLKCYSSNNLGLGTCRCVSHNPYNEEIVSREYVLKIINENPELTHQLNNDELNDLKQYQNDPNYQLKCKLEEKYQMTLEEIKASIEK